VYQLLNNKKIFVSGKFLINRDKAGERRTKS